ncbi:MAG: response regulator [Oxalobacteraceae bacterium]|nr:MAG: response regulator [Oxalobacteraceae bacterium]
MGEVSLDSLSVLVVDDEEPVRDLLGWMLEDAGYLTHSVPGGHEALAYMRARHQVDLVLSDINMPGMDGVALCKRWRWSFPPCQCC